MDSPLVFLTSTSDTAPSGRNARVIARASMVRQSTRSALARGTFTVFPMTSSQQERGVPQQSSFSDSSTRKRSSPLPTWEVAALHDAPIIPRVLGPQTVSVEGLLAIATTRIRHDLVLTLQKQPSRVRDILRCRQWAAAAFALGPQRLTPEVHSAVKYLEHKVQHIDQPAQQHGMGLQKYVKALSELQRSLRDPARRLQSSVLAASHILAVCEMLGGTISSSYLKFTSGIVALSNLQACKGDHDARLHIHSNGEGTILVEALLTKSNDAKLERPWPQILRSAADQGRLLPEDASSFAESAELIFSSPALEYVPMASPMNRDERVMLTARARRLHANLKRSVRGNLLPASTTKYICPLDATLDERIAVMLGLDDFVSQIAKGNENPSELVHNDDTTFYADAICAMWKFTEDMVKEKSKTAID